MIINKMGEPKAYSGIGPNLWTEPVRRGSNAS
jgi:hypothetical protein